MTVVILQTFIIAKPIVAGNSMEPNIKKNEYVLFSKMDSDYKRGDIVMFNILPKEDVREEVNVHMGRIIGLPGELVEIKDDGFVYVNSLRLDESDYLDSSIRTDKLKYSPRILGEEYFILSDNTRTLSVSFDSKGFGPVRKDRIVGTYWFSSPFLQKIFVK